MPNQVTRPEAITQRIKQEDKLTIYIIFEEDNRGCGKEMETWKIFLE